ncbi:MAG: PepSY-like domain-containing protein [Bacteroidetes bacterium]|nr:PepSY-like domain-containing protein [Bacteroidota bacterium]
MKKLLLLSAVGFFAVLNSCQKDSQVSDDELVQQIASASDKTVVATASLPATTATYIDENYFESYVEEAYLVTDKGYELVMGDANRIYCDPRGRILRPNRRRAADDGPCGRGEAVRPAQLPAAITNYVAENYPGAVIQRAKQLTSGTYFIKINDPGYILIFNENGRFIEATVLFYQCRPLGTPIDVATLPETITTYIADNFAGAEIKVAFQKNNGMIVVGIFTPEGRKILGFDADGNFLFVRP